MQLTFALNYLGAMLARTKAIDVSLFPALIELLEVVNLPGWGPALVP